MGRCATQCGAPPGNLLLQRQRRCAGYQQLRMSAPASLHMPPLLYDADAILDVNSEIDPPVPLVDLRQLGDRANVPR